MKKISLNLLATTSNKVLLVFPISLLLLSLSSCTYFNKDKAEESKGKLLASVQEARLYESDLAGILMGQFSKEDSILITQDFIDKWIHEELVYYKAVKNLTDVEKDKSEEIERYYRALITYEYKKKIVNQQLDEQISDEEITTYYDENRDQFVLKKCILKLKFLKLKVNAPDLKKVYKLFDSDKNEDHDLLLQYCLGNAVLFNLDDTKWFYIDEVNSQVPLGADECKFFNEGMTIESSDSSFIYLIKIREVKAKGAFSPLAFEKERIRNTILHKRSLELIKKVEEEIYTDGIKKNYFTVYE